MLWNVSGSSFNVVLLLASFPWDNIILFVRTTFIRMSLWWAFTVSLAAYLELLEQQIAAGSTFPEPAIFFFWMRHTIYGILDPGWGIELMHPTLEALNLNCWQEKSLPAI